MKWLSALLPIGHHAAAAIDPPAIVAPQLAERPAVVAAAAVRASPLQPDPLTLAAEAAGVSRTAMARALEAVARADLSSLHLTLNGPHTKAGDRVSRKGAKKAQRLLLAIADTAEDERSALF